MSSAARERVALAQPQSVEKSDGNNYTIVRAATDGPDRAPHGPARDHAANALDRQSRKDRDFDDLVDSAMHRRASTQKVLVPSKSKKNMQEVDLSKLTRSKRNLVVEQVLEVWQLQTSEVLGCGLST